MNIIARVLTRRGAALWLGCLFVLASIPGMGQVLKGSISATVTDPEGAVISGAQVKATNLATGTVSATTTDNSGLFRFNLIPVGDYRIEVTAPGFKTALENNIAVAAGRDSGLGSIKLSVGETSTTVEVSGEAPLIESTAAQVTNTFSGLALRQFSGIQENQGLDSLALFVPGVVTVRDNSFANTNGGAGFSVNGQRGRNNDQEIDGQNNNDNSVAGPSLFLSDSEFVQQYVIVTNNFGPEYGRNAGSVVNVITKSGGNAWHGSIYGNENNSIINTLTSGQKNATPPLTKPPRANDEFTGFTIGGPWIKNKLFFFGGFDNEILSTASLFNTGNLTPTPAGLATLQGCFPTGASADALAALAKFGPFGISAGNPKPGVLTTAMVAGCPSVQLSTVSRVLGTPTHAFNWVTREDLALGSDTISGRYIFNRSNVFNLNDNGAAGYVINVPALSQAVLISWTHNFTTHMVNEARLGYGRLNVEFGGNNIGTEPNTSNIFNGLTSINFTDGATLGFGPNAGFPQGRFVNTWQGQDNWNYLKGRHQLKAGVNYTYQQSPSIFLPAINGQYNFPNLTAFVLNQPSSVNITEGNPELGLKEHDTFLFFGDDWKISQNLTLNLGITWTYLGQPVNELNTLDTKRETGPTPLFNPALPLSVRVAPAIDSYKKAFGPSVGFAYSPQWGGFLTGHGKTVLRGGYRLSYDPPYYNIYSNNYGGAPNVLAATLTTPSTPAAALQLPANPIGPNVRTRLGPFIPVGLLDPRTLGETTVSNDFRPDQIQGWSLGFEREITKNAVFEARYAGNHGTNLFQSVNANPFVNDLKAAFPQFVPAGVTACADPAAPGFGRVHCDQGVVLSRNNSGYSDYQAVQLHFRASNLFKQVTANAAYTFSKTTDNVSEIFNTDGGATTVSLAQNPFNTGSAEHALSGLDIPHQFTITAVEEMPFFREQHGLIGHIMGGWSLAGSYIWNSGQTYTPFMAAFANLTAAGDFYDQNFLNAFNQGGLGVARPFLGNPGAPVDMVGMFAGDTCALLGAGCALPATQLVSLNALNAATPSVVNVTKNDVHFIANTGVAQTLFGTPFGNVARNALRDAPSNFLNFSVYKRVKLGERATFEFHTTFLNAFNHANFLGVNPFVENAGNPNFGNAFAIPSRSIDLFNGGTDSIPGSNLAASRRIYFGGVLRF